MTLETRLRYLLRAAHRAEREDNWRVAASYRRMASEATRMTGASYSLEGHLPDGALRISEAR